MWLARIGLGIGRLQDGPVWVLSGGDVDSPFAVFSGTLSGLYFCFRGNSARGRLSEGPVEWRTPTGVLHEGLCAVVGARVPVREE